MTHAKLIASSPQVAARMSRQRRVGTDPELRVRRELHRMGLRYRVEYPVPGLPRRSIDIAFTRRRVAVFIDGCFWHACPAHATSPKTNNIWWREKLDRNVSRDRETDANLIEAGWTVQRFWEHSPTPDIIAAIRRVLVCPERSSS